MVLREAPARADSPVDALRAMCRGSPKGRDAQRARTGVSGERVACDELWKEREIAVTREEHGHPVRQAQRGHARIVDEGTLDSWTAQEPP